MKDKKVKREAITLILKLIILSLSMFLLFDFVFGVMIVKENNMYPSVHEGDLLLYYKPSKDYKVNDVIVYEVEGIKHIGRIAAGASARVDFTDNGRLLLDNQVSIAEEFYETYPNDDSQIKFPLTVPKGEFFVLSDYRVDTNSDSRSYGTLSSDMIKGVVITVVRRRGF